MEDFLDHPSSKYSFSLKDFDGPLDLLLQLIREKNIDILDVKISDITDQYFEYMKHISEIDMDVASDFLAMAAMLLEIKSKSLLPVEEELEDEEDLESQLKRKLLEFKMFKDQAEKLRELETMNRFYRMPQYSESDVRLSFVNFNLKKMIDTFAKMLAYFPVEKAQEVTKKVEKEKFTVQEKLEHLSQNLVEFKKLDFYKLIGKDSTPQEVLNIFLALLELMKIQIAIAEQNPENDNIAIELKHNYTLEEIKKIAEEGVDTRGYSFTMDEDN